MNKGMIDLEKVIHGLEIQLDDLQKYADNDQPLSLTQERAQEIISMLKEQESVIEALKSDLDETLAVLGDQPEIVRCDKCTMRDRTKRCHIWGKDVKDDDYCSYGKWKKGEFDDRD